MKRMYVKISGVLAVLLVLIIMPTCAFGADQTLSDDTYNDFHIGQDYNLIVSTGSKTMVSCLECDADESLYLASAVNSDASVATLYFSGDETDIYFELQGLKAGNTTVTVTDKNGRKSVFNVTVRAGSSSDGDTSSSRSPSKTLKSRLSNDFKMGRDYKLTVKVGDAPSMWCDWSLVSDDDDKKLRLKSIKASKTGIVSTTKDDEAFYLYAKKTGKTKITVTDNMGNYSVISITVKKADKTIKTLKNEDETDFSICTNYKLILKTGDKLSLFVRNIQADWDGLDTVKTSRKSVADLTLYENCLDLKAKSAGKTTITLKDYKGRKTVIYVTVKPGKSTIESYDWIYKNTKTVTVDATNVVKGDKITLKIGNKTYSKKITETAKKARVKIKIKSPGFYGKKAQLKLVRKGKTVAKGSEYIYLSNIVKVGYTKKTVKWLTYWNKPVKKTSTAYSEMWWYDWDEDGYTEASLTFRNGRVTNWYTPG